MTRYFCSREIWPAESLMEDGKRSPKTSDPYCLRHAGHLITALRNSERNYNITLCTSCYNEGMKPVEAFLDRLERCVI